MRTAPYVNTDSGFKSTHFFVKGVSEGSTKNEDRAFNKIVNAVRKSVECLWGGEPTSSLPHCSRYDVSCQTS